MTNELNTKNPVGRPRFAGKPRLKRSIMIDDDDLATIAQLGAGNNSEGVHVLVEFYKNNINKSKTEPYFELFDR